jgi:hypothetical protein
MMPANRPWHSQEKKPFTKKEKIIMTTIAIIILALAIAVTVTNHKAEIAQKQQSKIEEAQQAKEVAKEAKDYIPWLENSMNEYNSIYNDMKNTWQPYNYNMASQLGPLLTRIYDLRKDVENKQSDVPDDSDGALYDAHQAHLNAINELYYAIATAIKEYAGIDTLSKDELAQIDNSMNSSFSDEKSAKEDKDDYVKNENNNNN